MQLQQTLYYNHACPFRSGGDANSFTATRFKAQANKFSGILSSGLNKTTRRLIRELNYGIQAAKDIKISNIARNLNEDIKLIKTEEMICRNLAANVI